MTPSYLPEIRQHFPERYLLSILAPADSRPHFWALLGFAAEVERIPFLVKEEMLGLIRLAWWRESIEAIYAGRAAASHPVLADLARYIDLFKPPILWFEAMIEARSEQMESSRIKDDASFRRFAFATSGVLLQLHQRSLDASPELIAAAGSLGEVYGEIELLRSLKLQRSRGELLLPEDRLFKHGMTRETISSGDGRKAFLKEKLQEIEGRNRFDSLPSRGVLLLQHHLNDLWLRRLQKHDPFAENFTDRIPLLALRLTAKALLTKP